jgi:hypothetical protein
MRRKMHQFLALDTHERWLLRHAFLGLLLTALALRWLSLRQLSAILTRRTPGHGHCVPDSAPALIQAHVTARLVHIAARHSPLHTTCLHRSLVLWWLLHCQGIESALRIGVRKQAGQLQAHAWVECQGTPLHDQHMLKHFVAFDQAIVSTRRGQR